MTAIGSGDELHARVVIVGAGLSGLTAARTLVTSGVPPESIVVLEAGDYVGGRALTVETRSGARVDCAFLFRSCCARYRLFALHAMRGGDEAWFA